MFIKLLICIIIGLFAYGFIRAIQVVSKSSENTND